MNESNDNEVMLELQAPTLLPPAIGYAKYIRAHRCCRGMWSKRRCKNKAQWQSSVTISRKHGGKKVQTFWCYAHKGEDDVPLRPNDKLSHDAH